MDKILLQNTAKRMLENGKGILAADESLNTIKKRLEAVGVENNPQNRRQYRQLLITTSQDFRDYISAIILFDETLGQSCDDGVKFTEVLQKNDCVIGIKVDQGLKNLSDSPSDSNDSEKEKITDGLQNLDERMKKYFELGVRFAKWRAVFLPTENTPSQKIIDINVSRLAQYAKISQQNNILPIVEAEVLMDGEHNIEKSRQTTQKVLQRLYEELDKQKIWLEATILKPNMVIAGAKCDKQNNPSEIALQTVHALEKSVPQNIAGIAFLSGGQQDIQATENLNEIRLAAEKMDYKTPLTFSFGRALQQNVLKTWNGKKENVEKAKKALIQRAKMNSLAAKGQWHRQLEK